MDEAAEDNGVGDGTGAVGVNYDIPSPPVDLFYDTLEDENQQAKVGLVVKLQAGKGVQVHIGPGARGCPVGPFTETSIHACRRQRQRHHCPAADGPQPHACIPRRCAAASILILCCSEELFTILYRRGFPPELHCRHRGTLAIVHALHMPNSMPYRSCPTAAMTRQTVYIVTIFRQQPSSAGRRKHNSPANGP